MKCGWQNGCLQFTVPGSPSWVSLVLLSLGEPHKPPGEILTRLQQEFVRLAYKEEFSSICTSQSIQRRSYFKEHNGFSEFNSLGKGPNIMV